MMKPLPPMPARIAALPMSDRGYPVPFFVAYVDGKPEFRIADAAKHIVCVKESRCYVCGQKLGRYRCFPIGPMCVVNRNTAEPPCHHECAEWSARACPFMLMPKMERRENNLPEGASAPAGIAIRRNPGCVALYTCQDYRINAETNGFLFGLGDPVRVEWFAEGRAATRAEVEESIRTGLPLLQQACADESELRLLAQYVERANQYLPSLNGTQNQKNQEDQENEPHSPARPVAPI